MRWVSCNFKVTSHGFMVLETHFLRFQGSSESDFLALVGSSCNMKAVMAWVSCNFMVTLWSTSHGFMVLETLRRALRVGSLDLTKSLHAQFRSKNGLNYIPQS